MVWERSDDLEVDSKAWPVRQSKCFSRQALDEERQTIRGPAEQEMPFVPDGVVHFSKESCAKCPLQAQCTTSAKGRSVDIHPDEALLTELQERQQIPQGRAKLRERVQLSIPWLMEVSGRDDAPVIADFARISSIYVDAQLSTICMSWLVPSSFLLSFRMRLDFLTDTLAASRPAPQGYRLAGRQQAEAILPTGL